ncbi:LuxR C-terminal-related transcriptional regulator [Embleya sp. MST-111070]|uniref:LuxR C-terminal-related transcriptional regulator n=1 Tax=Embleya sp. MST-111070 TaxID=3398231 RepID=UPI003F73B863
MSVAIEVLVITPVRIYRDATVRALADEPALRLVGSGGSASEAVAGARRLRPSVLLLDLSTPDSIPAIRAIRRGTPQTRLIALGVDETRDDVITAAEAGVAGFIGREYSLPQTAAAIIGVVRGEASCSPRIAALLLQRVQSPTVAAQRTVSALPETLTAREREILFLIAEGRTNHEIARGLSIGLSTVKTHVHAVLRKLRVPHREAAAGLLRATPAGEPLGRSRVEADGAPDRALGAPRAASPPVWGSRAPRTRRAPDHEPPAGGGPTTG